MLPFIAVIYARLAKLRRKSKSTSGNASDQPPTADKLSTQQLSQFLKKKRLSARPASYLDRLPTEILLLIDRYLSLQSSFFLSRTCRLTRKVLREKCWARIEQLNVEQVAHVKEWTASADLDLYPCMLCKERHGIDFEDAPGTSTDSYRARHRSCLGSTERRLLSTGVDYHLDFAHVHFALKLARVRRPSKLYADYLQKLLKSKRSTKTWQNVSVMYTADPKVEPGSFMLRSRWHIEPESQEDFNESHFPINELPLCPHNIGKVCVKLWTSAHLNGVISDAPKGPPTAYYKCCYCATEVRVAFDNPRLLSVTAFQDFGDSLFAKPEQWLSGPDGVERAGSSPGSLASVLEGRTGPLRKNPLSVSFLEMPLETKYHRQWRPSHFTRKSS